MQESELLDVHPVDMLVDLVIEDRIDPWEVDVGEIATRFLERVRSMQRLNLRLSGRTLLAASLLLRMKSERILEREDEEEEEEPQEEEEPEGVVEGLREEQEPPALPVPARRRVRRRTTIFELVEALQRALSEEVLRRNFPRGRRDRSLVIQVDEEDIREKIEKVYSTLTEVCASMGTVSFSYLVQGRERREMVETLLCLLYLSAQGRILMWQEEIFGEIFISLPES